MTGAHGHESHQAAQKPDRATMWRQSLARAPIAVSAAFDARGRLWLARVQDGHVLVSVSEDRGRTFSAPTKVNAEPELVAADGENRPKLAFGRNGEIYVSWTQSLEVPFAGHVRFSRSLDGGRTFVSPITVNDNREAISHRFESLAVDGTGQVWLLWLDRRDQAAATKAGAVFSGISLYAATSEDGGASFAPNRKVAEHTCECCRIALTLDRDGTPLAAWRHVYGRNTRDHAWLRLDGRSAPQRLGEEQWATDACPHHGPSLAVSADGSVHAAWYSGAAARAGLFYARSDNSRASFGTPGAFGDSDAQSGHPSVLTLGRSVYLAWKEFDGKNTVIRLMHSADGGKSWSAVRTLATTADRSDHPQLIGDGKAAFLAWNTTREGFRLIEVTGP
jgi:hypothetical protein